MDHKVAAIILAGGKGTRLEFLTKKVAKPAVGFAAKYRIIDFPLSNCANTGIKVVGVCTQYESTLLETYLGSGEKWGINGNGSTFTSLSPRQTEEGANWYKGTADAIWQNAEFIDSQNVEYVLVLSGDHIYKTTYNDMISLHVNSNAAATISVIPVPMKEASRFGIMEVDENDQIVKFQEKPKEPKSNLASMGVYVFTWKTLRRYLKRDATDENSSHDFGKDIIPALLKDEKKLMAYRYEKYWKDVGTISSLHEANMDLIEGKDELGLYETKDGLIYTEDTRSVPQYIGPKANVTKSLVNQGAIIMGNINNCVVSDEVIIEEGAELNRCVVMSGAKVSNGAKIKNAIIAPGIVIEENEEINLYSDEIVLVTNRRN